MKTQINISNLKKLAATVLASLLIATGSYTQPGKGNNESKEISVEMERLEVLSNATEASLKYTAPAVEETEEVTFEMERLEMLVAATEASLRYTAPVAEDHDENNTESVKETMLAEKTN